MIYAEDKQRPEDSEYEVANMKQGVGQLEVYPSIWGHWAGGPGGSPDDVKWLDDHFRALLEESPSNVESGLSNLKI